MYSKSMLFTEVVNRSKKNKNFYQDKKYLQHINLLEVESKYSFTEKEDMEWMDIPYEHTEDFSVLKDYYEEFCIKRFSKMKRLFFEALDIEFEEVFDEIAVQEVFVPTKDKSMGKNVKFADKCVVELIKKYGSNLVKVNRSTFKTADDKNGFVIMTSKMYKQGKKEKYWFAYRENYSNYTKDCENQYIVYGCKDENCMLIIPVREIEMKLEVLNCSFDDEGKISHWHMVFFKEEDKITWMLSKPSVEEIDVSKFLIENIELSDIN